MLGSWCLVGEVMPLTVNEVGNEIHIYERGGSADDFDDRIVIERRNDRFGVWGIAAHSRRCQTWSLASASEISQVIRNADDCESIDEWCDLLGLSDEQRGVHHREHREWRR